MTMGISEKQAASDALERAVGKVRRTLALDVINPLKGLAKVVDDGVFDVEHGEPVQNFKIPGQVNAILSAAQKVMAGLEEVDSAMSREANMSARVAARFRRAVQEGQIAQQQRADWEMTIRDPDGDEKIQIGPAGPGEQQGAITRPTPMAGEHEAVAPPGWEETVKKMKKHKEIDNPWALAWHMKNKGDKPHHASDPKVFLAANRIFKANFGYFQKSFVEGGKSKEDPNHAEHEIRSSAARAIEAIKKLEESAGKPSPLGPPLGHMASLEDNVDSLAYWMGVLYAAVQKNAPAWPRE